MTEVLAAFVWEPVGKHSERHRFVEPAHSFNDVPECSTGFSTFAAPKQLHFCLHRSSRLQMRLLAGAERKLCSYQKIERQRGRIIGGVEAKTLKMTLFSIVLIIHSRITAATDVCPSAGTNHVPVSSCRNIAFYLNIRPIESFILFLFVVYIF